MMASKGDAVFDLEARLGTEVVHQVLADSRKMTNHGCPELLEVVFSADAGKHQQVWRSDRTRSASNIEYFALAFGFLADGLAILDYDLPDKHTAPHRQV